MSILRSLKQIHSLCVCLQVSNKAMSCKHLIFLVLGALFVFVSASFAGSGGYVVGEGDVLKITVYDHPDLATKVRVNGDGQILMPLLGHVDVAGLTVSQISKKLAKMLADGYLVDPQVNVFIEEYGSKKAVILGMVKNPGLYELSGPTTLLELISKAGGLSKDAGNKVTIKRIDPDGKKEVINIDLKALMEGGDISLNVQIKDGDNVYVSKAGMVYVTGEVKEPDAYKIDEGTTVIKAIALAGGFTGKAAKGKIKIIRLVNGKKIVLKNVPLDTPVLPEDVIVVPESFF